PSVRLRSAPGAARRAGAGRARLRVAPFRTPVSSRAALRAALLVDQGRSRALPDGAGGVESRTFETPASPLSAVAAGGEADGVTASTRRSTTGHRSHPLAISRPAWAAGARATRRPPSSGGSPSSPPRS